ncbi:mannose-6-phosphate isomerase [Rhizobium sp. BK068]|nr:mannose-6-phosphate isomerase [Rhizobium sp. BK068]
MQSATLYKIGDNDRRPWGTWYVLDIGERHVVKRIVVNPGARLPLQYHNPPIRAMDCCVGARRSRN